MNDKTKKTMIVLFAFLFVVLPVMTLAGCENSTNQSETSANTLKSQLTSPEETLSTPTNNMPSSIEMPTPTVTLENTTETQSVQSAEVTDEMKHAAGKNVYYDIPALDGDIADILGFVNNEEWNYDPDARTYSITDQPADGTDFTYSIQCWIPESESIYKYMINIYYYDRAHTPVSGTVILVHQNEANAIDRFYDMKWADLHWDDLYNGTYDLLAGNVCIFHRPQWEIDNAPKICRQTFLHMCSLLKIDAEQLPLTPVRKLTDFFTVEIPALSDSIKNLLGVEDGNGWQYTPKSDRYFLYNAPVPGTDYSYTVRYVENKDTHHEDVDATISYFDYYHGCSVDCFIVIYEEGTKAAQEISINGSGKGSFEIYADNVYIQYRTNYSNEYIERGCDVNMIYDCARHLCSMLGIDYDALALSNS